MTDTRKRAELLDALMESDGLRPGVSREAARAVGVPEAQAYGTGSFYHLLAHPETKVRICQGLSCATRDSGGLLKRALEAGWPVEGCGCLAACDRPVAVLRGRDVLTAVDATAISAAGKNYEALESRTTNQAYPGRSGSEGAEGPKISTSTRDDGLAFNLEGKRDFSGHALSRARTLGSTAVLETLEASGLQGRGGAGFPAHTKWKSVCNQKEKTRFVVLNADEGEPGTFKDRKL